MEESPKGIAVQDFRCRRPWRWQEDGLTVTRTTVWSAPGCHEGCGVLVYTDHEGRFVKIEGDEENPFNRGRLCPRCFCIDEVLNHPDRIVHPMRRVRERRGDPKGWETVSWDDALDCCYSEMKRIADIYGADTIHFQRGTGRDVQWQVGRLAYAVGSPNEYGAMSGNSCYLPRLSQMIISAGGQLIADMSAFLAQRYDDPRYVVPSCVIVWGCDPLTSNPDFQLGHWVTDLMQRGTKIVTVDPRTTWLAAHSEIHLALRPGTDGALAMGILNVLITEGLYDRDFVDRWTYGFEALAERVSAWTPQETAKVCWVDAEDIVATARLFAQKKPSSVFWGVAVDMQNSGTGAAQAIQAIFTITGNIDIPGGMVFTQMPFGLTHDMGGGWGMDELLSPEALEKRCGIDKYPMFRFGIRHAVPDEALIAAEEGRCKAMWLQSTNTLAGMGDEYERWSKVFADLEFCVVVDLFMTPTAQAAADVFLPIKCWPEKMSKRAYYYDVSIMNPCVTPRGEVKSDAEINLELGRMFSKKAWPWKTEEEIYDEILTPTGLTWSQLRDRGPLYPEYQYGLHEKGLLRPDGKPGFYTPTGRLELYITMFEQMGYDPLPNFSEPEMSPVSSPQLFEQYPIILMTGARSGVYFHTEHRQIKSLRQFETDPFVQLSPATARELGVEDGQWVWLENLRGRCRQRVQVTQMIRDGMALARHGWWYPEKKDAELFDMPQVNINRLLKNAPSPTGFGADIKCTLCKIYPVNREEV